MDVVVYESLNTSLLGLLEEILSDHNIPYMVTGAADIGAMDRPVKIQVPEQYAEQARELIKLTI